jgi:hypothetical protein
LTFSSEKTCPSATFVHHKIPHDLAGVWTRAAALGSQRLTAWAMARPCIGGWVDSWVCLDDVEEKEFLTLPVLELRLLSRPFRSQSLYLLRYLTMYDFATKTILMTFKLPAKIYILHLNLLRLFTSVWHRPVPLIWATVLLSWQHSY